MVVVEITLVAEPAVAEIAAVEIAVAEIAAAATAVVETAVVETAVVETAVAVELGAQDPLLRQKPWQPWKAAVLVVAETATAAPDLGLCKYFLHKSSKAAIRPRSDGCFVGFSGDKLLCYSLA